MTPGERAMRLLLNSVAATVLLIAAADAAGTDVNSKVEHVTVYPDGASVTRLVEADLAAGDQTLIARDFPPSLDPTSLRVEGAGSSRIVIGAIDARPPRAEGPPVSPELEQCIEALTDERAVLDDKIAAAAARKKFARRFAETSPVGLGEKGEARPLDEWRAAFAAVEEEIATADGVIRSAKLRQRDIDRELARLKAEETANPPRKMEVRIDLAADAGTHAALRVTYSVRGARWVPIYDARLETGSRDRKPSLELIRRAEIVQRTGEDWNDVAVEVATLRMAKGGSAPRLKPLIVGYPVPLPASSAVELNTPLAPTPRQKLDALKAEDGRKAAGDFAAGEREALLDSGGFQAIYRIPGRISVATNEGAKSFRIASATISPDLVARTTPAIDATAFLEADFKHAEDAPLLPGAVAAHRDGVYVGRGQLTLTAKDETVRLGFGADEKITVMRTLTRKLEGSTGIISSAKTGEREYKMTIHNGHDTPIAVSVEDQLPVSEIAEVQVEMLPVTTPPTERDPQDRRGVLVWKYNAPAGDVRDIKLGWRVRWPSDKAIIYSPPRS
jgi:uncharacterized protein (TIGR02231 family)